MRFNSGRIVLIGCDAMIGAHCPVCGPPDEGGVV